ncbi:MAG: hypothetical protein WCH86_01295 [Kiritimatiellales bacterium]
MKSIPIAIRFIIALFAVFTLCLSADAGRWAWQEMALDEEAFCDQYMPKILEIQKSQGTDAALKEIERVYQLAGEQFGDDRFFFNVLWYEAQFNGGRSNEEWGLAVYQYLWDRDLKIHPEYNLSLPVYHYCLLGNIVLMNYELGRAAQARAICNKVENYLKSQKGLDTDCIGYDDLGPIFSFLPDARRYNAPIYEQDLLEHTQGLTASDQQDLIWYPFLYGISDVAESAKNSGDWIKAAELSAWNIRYADEFMKSRHQMRGEVGRVLGLFSYKLLSDLALLHGYPDEAARFLRDFLTKAEGYYGTRQRDVLRAKLDLAVIRIRTGGLTEDDLALADEAEKQIAGFRWNSRSVVLNGSLNKARVYHALGHKQEAWKMVDTLFVQTATDVTPYHRIRILNTAIDLALDDGAVRPELEEWLLLALENARRAGNKFEELPLYEKYAQFLMMKGCYADAVQIQQEAVRLAKAMSLPKRLQDNLAVLEGMRNRIARKAVDSMAEMERPAPEEKIGRTEPAPTKPVPTKGVRQPVAGVGVQFIPSVDVQPRRSLSAALAGQAAYGRFYIHNPAGVSQQGEIRLNGSIGQLKRQDEQWLTVSASPVFENVQRVYPLSLDPGASCIVDVFAQPRENGTGAAVQCEWIPLNSQQAGVSGSWEYRAAEIGKRTTVIDAHAFQDNPFYLIPIHHMIQRLDAEQQQTVDFSVRSSTPMRIETYDAVSGKLISIDANGDGDFLDQGDQIIGDANRNSWPDLVFEPGQRLASLVMYIQPVGSTTGDKELTVSICVQDKWQTDAIDVITPASR